MKQTLAFCSWLLLFCLPQTVLSTVAILAYVRAGIFPSYSVGFHVCLVLAFHLLFFSSWAVLSRRWRGADRGWFRGLYALSCLAKWMMINLVYLGSYASYGLWSAYLTWANLQATGAHLRGFHQAMGAQVYGALAIAGLLLLGYFLLILRATRLSLRKLESLFAAPAAVGRSALLVTLALVAGLNFWFRDPLWLETGRRDPLLAFWTNRAAAEPVLTPAMLADRAAARAYQVPADFHRRNVIVVVIDCLRTDHLPFRGYARPTTPFLSALHEAGRLQVVDFAVSNGNDSPQGIRAILNSRYAHRQHIHNFRLQDVLKRAGYRTHVIGTGDHTSFGNLRAHYGPNIDVFLDGLTTRSFSVNDDRGLLESLEKIPAAGAQPAFFYIHLMSVHELGVRERRFARWQPARLTMDWNAFLGRQADWQTAINTYDNGLLQADHYLERIFARLEAKGYLADYVAVIAGDHGQALGERGHYGHTKHLYAVDMNTPIMFLESSPADYGPLPFASQVDIAPTLLDRLGLPRPAQWAGQSLYRSPAPLSACAVGAGENSWKALVQRRDGEIYKYLFHGRHAAEFTEHLYALVRDPGESNDLVPDASARGLLLEFRDAAAKEFGLPVPPTH